MLNNLYFDKNGCRRGGENPITRNDFRSLFYRVKCTSDDPISFLLACVGSIECGDMMRGQLATYNSHNFIPLVFRLMS